MGCGGHRKLRTAEAPKRCGAQRTERTRVWCRVDRARKGGTRVGEHRKDWRGKEGSALKGPSEGTRGGGGVESCFLMDTVSVLQDE